MGNFVVFKGRDGQFYWALKASNGETLCHSEGYTAKQSALNGVAACKKYAASAGVVDNC